MATIAETIGRSALLAAASNYKSVAEAMMELIDNPFDKRWGRHLTIDITIDKKNGIATILDVGGEGMDDEGLQEWIRWGEGRGHSATDIGQYHIGGKLAAMYLAEGLEIVSRKSGEHETWRFGDPEWGSRREVLEEAPIESTTDTSIRWPNGKPKTSAGFTRLTLQALKPHRYDLKRLTVTLAETYRTLILNGDCIIRLNGEEVRPLEIPWSNSVEIREIGLTSVGLGVRIKGKIGAIDRDRLPESYTRLEPGIRTEFNGRRISEGEGFGHNLAGRGTLGRLYGEIEIIGQTLTPNQLKDGWPMDSEGWQAVENYLREEMRPVVNELNRIAGARSATREENKWANNALKRIGNAVQILETLKQDGNAAHDSESGGSQGRKRPEAKAEEKTESEKATIRARSERRPRTPAPENAVGRLRRLAKHLPRVDYDELGPGSRRTEWRNNDDSTRTIIINRDYPLATGRLNQDYVFEAVAIHIVSEDAATLQEFKDMFDRLVWADKKAQEG